MKIPTIKFINNACDEIRYQPKTAAKRVFLSALSCAFMYATINLASKSVSASRSLGIRMIFQGSSHAYVELGCILLALTACAVSSVKIAQKGYCLTNQTPSKQTMLSQ